MAEKRTSSSVPMDEITTLTGNVEPSLRRAATRVPSPIACRRAWPVNPVRRRT